MLGPFATASRRTPIHQVSLPVLSHAAYASMSTTTTTTTTTTTRDRGDRYGPMEWAQKCSRTDLASTSAEARETFALLLAVDLVVVVPFHPPTAVAAVHARRPLALTRHLRILALYQPTDVTPIAVQFTPPVSTFRRDHALGTCACA